MGPRGKACPRGPRGEGCSGQGRDGEQDRVRRQDLGTPMEEREAMGVTCWK